MPILKVVLIDSNKIVGEYDQELQHTADKPVAS